jgi:hypothetical protein
MPKEDLKFSQSMKKLLKKQKFLSTDLRQYTQQDSDENSFLQETTFNSNVDLEIREQIEMKFKKSSVNSKYVFPRNSSNEKKPKKSPLRIRSTIKHPVAFEKTLPNLHKITKSSYESTGILSNLINLKKVHRTTSSIKNPKGTKLAKSKNNTLKYTSRTLSSNARSKTPLMYKKETSTEDLMKNTLRKQYRPQANKTKKTENPYTKPVPASKNSGHLYTSSIESVIPSSIIKSVSYY